MQTQKHIAKRCSAYVLEIAVRSFLLAHSGNVVQQGPHVEGAKIVPETLVLLKATAPAKRCWGVLVLSLSALDPRKRVRRRMDHLLHAACRMRKCGGTAHMNALKAARMCATE
jgi:hypothetical protein